jgi:hypothetical protein
MMSPLPGTNTLPAVGIFVTGFGLLDDDGFISLSGITICVLALVLSIAIHGAFFLGGMTLVDQMLEQIKP